MSTLSQINLNGTDYEIEDAYAREQLENISGGSEKEDSVATKISDWFTAHPSANNHYLSELTSGNIPAWAFEFTSVTAGTYVPYSATKLALFVGATETTDNTSYAYIIYDSGKILTFDETGNEFQNIATVNINEFVTNTDLQNALSGITGVRFEVVSTLPTENISTSTIYLVANSSDESENGYDEYIYIDEDGTLKWEKVGSVGGSIDLSGYATTTELNTGLASKINKPSGVANNKIAVTDSEESDHIKWVDYDTVEYANAFPAPSVAGTFKIDMDDVQAVIIYNLVSGLTIYVGSAMMEFTPEVPLGVRLFNNTSLYLEYNGGVIAKADVDESDSHENVPIEFVNPVILTDSNLGTLTLSGTGTITQWVYTETQSATKYSTGYIKYGNDYYTLPGNVPSKTSDLVNDSDFVNSTQLATGLAGKVALPSVVGTEGQVLALDNSLAPVWKTVESGGGESSADECKVKNVFYSTEPTVYTDIASSKNDIKFVTPVKSEIPGDGSFEARYFYPTDNTVIALNKNFSSLGNIGRYFVYNFYTKDDYPCINYSGIYKTNSGLSIQSEGDYNLRYESNSTRYNLGIMKEANGYLFILPGDGGYSDNKCMRIKYNVNPNTVFDTPEQYSIPAEFALPYLNYTADSFGLQYEQYRFLIELYALSDTDIVFTSHNSEYYMYSNDNGETWTLGEYPNNVKPFASHITKTKNSIVIFDHNNGKFYETKDLVNWSELYSISAEDTSSQGIYYGSSYTGKLFYHSKFGLVFFDKNAGGFTLKDSKIRKMQNPVREGLVCDIANGVTMKYYEDINMLILFEGYGICAPVFASIIENFDGSISIFKLFRDDEELNNYGGLMDNGGWYGDGSLQAYPYGQLNRILDKPIGNKIYYKKYDVDTHTYKYLTYGFDEIGGGTEYTAGDGITITDDEISVTDPIPAHTSSDSGKVLNVESDGTLAWAEVSGVLKVNAIPDLPDTDGTYTLQVTIHNGTPTYEWVSQE